MPQGLKERSEEDLVLAKGYLPNEDQCATLRRRNRCQEVVKHLAQSRGATIGVSAAEATEHGRQTG
jgi:hypothetical protein